MDAFEFFEVFVLFLLIQQPMSATIVVTMVMSVSVSGIVQDMAFSKYFWRPRREARNFRVKIP